MNSATSATSRKSFGSLIGLTFLVFVAVRGIPLQIGGGTAVARDAAAPANAGAPARRRGRVCAAATGNADSARENARLAANCLTGGDPLPTSAVFIVNARTRRDFLTRSDCLTVPAGARRGKQPRCRG